MNSMPSRVGTNGTGSPDSTSITRLILKARSARRSVAWGRADSWLMRKSNDFVPCGGRAIWSTLKHEQADS